MDGQCEKKTRWIDHWNSWFTNSVQIQYSIWEPVVFWHRRSRDDLLQIVSFGTFGTFSIQGLQGNVNSLLSKATAIYCDTRFQSNRIVKSMMVVFWICPTYQWHFTIDIKTDTTKILKNRVMQHENPFNPNPDSSLQWTPSSRLCRGIITDSSLIVILSSPNHKSPWWDTRILL